MFSSNLTKFFAFFALVILFFTGCGFWNRTSGPTPAGTPPPAEILQSGVPFKTTEPENFQAEIVIKTGETERRTFIARNGQKRRSDFGFGEKDQLSAVSSDKNYLWLQSRKLFSESVTATGGAGDDWSDFLTTEWLSDKTSATFEKLETTGNVTKYRVNIASGDSSEVLVYVDENLGLPVKQEYFTVAGETRTLAYSFELRNFKSGADDALFAVPAGFRKVSAEDFYKTLRTLEH